jgi:hypothetical protein
MTRNVRKICRILVFGGLLFFSSCSDNPPEILQISWQVMLFNNREASYGYQKLSIFLHIRDEDGIKDIGALYIINDDAELFWSLKEDSWKMVTKGSETWLGSDGLTMPGGEAFPSGKYRVLLEDLSGQSDETGIYLSKENVDTFQTTIPESSSDNEKIYVKGEFNNFELWVYDKNNKYVAAFPIDEQGIKTEVILSRDPALGAAFTYYVYCVNKKNSFGILTGPYYYTVSTPGE